MKFVFPAVWLSGFPAATILLSTSGGFTDPGGLPPPPEIRWLFLGATVLGGVFLYWCCMPLKRVEINERWLYVSNYFREIRVPLEDVEDASENRWINIRPVIVTFRRETEFGSRITFMPKHAGGDSGVRTQSLASSRRLLGRCEDCRPSGLDEVLLLLSASPSARPPVRPSARPPSRPEPSASLGRSRQD